jgi:hypothetical protein
MRVDVETVSPLAAGQTVCDVWHQSTLPKNCRVARSMDVPAFWRMLLAAIEAADAAAPMNQGWQRPPGASSAAGAAGGAAGDASAS